MQVPTRYNNFRLWVQRNGCKMDSRIKIQADQSGSMGLESSEELPGNTVVMAIPQKLILTVEKCYYSELRKLYEGNDDLFDYEDSDDAQFNVLAVFIMYEKAKVIRGKRQSKQQFFSFWQPYIESVEQAETAMDWRQEEIQDFYQEMREEIDHFRREIIRMQKRVVSYLIKRPQFRDLSQAELNQLFNFGYKFIMTRCFGYCTPGTSLIPLADLMNHGCQAVEHQLINLKRQKQPATEEYKIHSDRIDMSILQADILVPPVSFSPSSQFISQKTQMRVEDAEKMTRSERRKTILQINQHSDDFMNENFFSSSDEEDNDTQSNEQETREQEMQFLTAQEKQQMEVFKDHWERIRVVEYGAVEKQLNEIEKIESQFEYLKPKEEDETREDIKASEKEIEEPKESKNEQVKEQKVQEKAQKESEIVKEPSIQQSVQPAETRQHQIIDQAIKQRALNQLLLQNNLSSQMTKLSMVQSSSDSQSESSEEQFTWFKEPGTYFLITTSRPVAAHQQLLNCYGRRTNKFLLIWYGFCYQNNLFDSVSFRMHVNFTNDAGNMIFQHYYGGRGLIKGFSRENGKPIDSNEVSRQFRLKRTRICQNLLVFLRLFLLYQYKGSEIKKIFVTFPSSLQYQIFVLSYMENLVRKLYERYPATIEGTDYRSKFKKVFMADQIGILDSNIEMIAEARSLLMKLQMNQGLTFDQLLKDYKNMGVLRKLRVYLKSVRDNIDYVRL